MNKTQFIASLAPHFNGSKKEAAHAVEIVFDSIVRNIQKAKMSPSTTLVSSRKLIVKLARDVTLSLAKRSKSLLRRSRLSGQAKR